MDRRHGIPALSFSLHSTDDSATSSERSPSWVIVSWLAPAGEEIMQLRSGALLSQEARRRESIEIKDRDEQQRSENGRPEQELLHEPISVSESTAIESLQREQKVVERS